MRQSYDVVVIGGGIGGSTFASRLHSYRPDLSIAIVEAGPNVTSYPLVPEAKNSARLIGSELDWNYLTEEQEHLKKRRLANNAGKALGGGSAINAGGWIRGPAADYDSWSRLVKSKRWSYKAQLPYFRRTENYHDSTASVDEHGYNGPIHTQSVSSSGRDYPLRQRLQAAWFEAGVKNIADANSGYPEGLGELVENRNDGMRQLASTVYPLDGVTVLTDTLVAKVVLAEDAGKIGASGIQLSDGTIIMATKEVVVAAGAYRTPQVLLLSGIGPKTELSAHGITSMVDSPYVGKNLHDHMGVSLWWKLRNPEGNLAAGAPGFAKPEYANGLPLDWIVTLPANLEHLKSALEPDDEAPNTKQLLLQEGRVHYEAFCVYASMNPANPKVDFDGTHITTRVVGLYPTSRGTVALRSSDPSKPPVIDPKYYSTEADRCVIRDGIRKWCQIMLGTAEGKALVVSEAVKDGSQGLSQTSDDLSIDDVVADRASTVYHPAGTASMGKVVDTELKVIGVDRLRVVDASVFPLPIAGHYQAPVYALAEQAADIVAAEV